MDWNSLARRTLGFAWAKARIALARRRHGLTALALSSLITSATLVVAAWYMARDDRLGVVHFRISCGWQSQQNFNTATALLHLFQFADAEQVYTEIAKHEPDCAIAYWGIAMSRLKNPLYAPPNSEDVAVATAALATAATARVASSSERAYLAAAGKLFTAPYSSGQQERKLAYAEAMATVSSQYPEDKEAIIFYALALNLTTSSSDRTGTNRTKAAELLLQVFAEEPDHPGMDHYLTYCLGHALYQPRPFERVPMSTPTQRILLTALSLLALCGTGVFVMRTADLDPYTNSSSVIGGPFLLTAGDGRMVTDQTFRGRWLLVYFGYTHCPNVCPTTLNAIAVGLEKLGPLAAKIQPLFFTIDPERDTPEVVNAFAKAFDSRIVGLTGKATEIAAVAKEYRAFFKRVPSADSDEYFMEHSAYVFVMGPDGRYVTLFTPDQAESPDKIASRMRELLTGPA
jgi:protein SCO1/2